MWMSRTFTRAEQPWRAQPVAGAQWPVLLLALSSPYYHITRISAGTINFYVLLNALSVKFEVAELWNELTWEMLEEEEGEGMEDDSNFSQISSQQLFLAAVRSSLWFT